MTHTELLQQLDALHPDCYAWARACCRGESGEAEDVLQTAYLQVLDGRARFDGRSSLKTWLFSVIRRTAAGERRRRLLRRLLLERNWTSETTAVVSPELATEHSDRATRLRGALRQLAPRQQSVLELVFYHDLTIEEAAAVMGVSLGTARTHYDRGKKRIASLLNGDLR
jgi:RNA polymerase sigma factor (sigma-70 family)